MASFGKDRIEEAKLQLKGRAGLGRGVSGRLTSAPALAWCELKRRLLNEAWIDEMKRLSGVRIAPVTVIGEKAFYGSFDQQRPQLEAALAAR